MLRLLDVEARDDPVAQDVLLVVDVVEEEVQRDDPLGQAGFQMLPLGRRDHPRHGIERENPLGPAVVVIDVEGHPLPQEMLVAGGATGIEVVRGQTRKTFEQGPVMRPDFATRGEHLVEKSICLVGFKHAHSWGGDGLSRARANF